jgi:hypothetical protein
MPKLRDLAPTLERRLSLAHREGRIGCVVLGVCLINLAAGGAVLFGWPAPLLSGDVNWLITFDLRDVYPQRTLLTTALACSQVGLLALWCGAGRGRAAPRWLGLASGIAVWSVVLEFLHPVVADSADSRALFVMQAAMVLIAMGGVQFFRGGEGRRAAEVRQWSLRDLLWLTGLTCFALATSRFVQPNVFSSPVNWTVSYWRVAVAAACAAITLLGWWAGRRVWTRSPAALAAFAVVGAGLAIAFARVELLWPPAHNPGEAHYPEVFRAFCLSYALWAVVQGTYVLGLVAAMRAIHARAPSPAPANEWSVPSPLPLPGEQP